MNFTFKKQTDLPEIGILFLRVFFGFTLIINHGWPAIQKVFTGDFGYPDPLGIGQTSSLILMATAEFLCALFTLVGYKTRLACVPIILGFIVAFFVFHAQDPFEEKELAFLYLSAFTGILILGSGKFSMDYFISNK